MTEVGAGEVVAVHEGSMRCCDVIMRSLVAEVWSRSIIPG